MKTCDECYCNDSKDNPIIEELDELGYVIKRMCMMCYVESLDED